MAEEEKEVVDVDSSGSERARRTRSATAEKAAAELFSAPMDRKPSQIKYAMAAINSKWKYVPQTTKNLAISCCCFAEDGNQNVQRFIMFGVVLVAIVVLVYLSSLLRMRLMFCEL